MLSEPLTVDKLLIIGAMGFFFLTGLLTGAWKYWRTLRRPDHQAPVYTARPC